MRGTEHIGRVERGKCSKKGAQYDELASFVRGCDAKDGRPH